MARTEHDLGVALDGSFVETTSRSAAQALAQHYASQDGGQTVYYVQARVEPNGKTIYRIRPRSQPTPALASTSEASSGSATASTSQVPAKCSASSEAPAPMIALHTPSPRKPTPRSGPTQRLERYPQQTASDNEGLSPYFKSSTVMALQRSGSQPTLGAARSQSHGWKSTTIRTASREQSDVLGRILGWSTSGTAHLGFTPGTETRSNVNDEDKSDLPQDLVDELEGRAPPATPQYREPSPSSSTPFGAGVRLAEGSLHPRSPASDTASPLPVLLLADPPRRREMREVASSDSIRTAKAVDDRLPMPSPHQSRYKDWTAYDLLQNLDTLDHHSLPREPIFRFGRHPAASSASVGSSASDISRTTGQDITVLSTPGDDPRFVIWGVKDQRGHARVASKPSEDSRVNVASSDGGQRRGSIAPAPAVASPVMSSPATASSSSRWSLSQPHHQSESPGTSVRNSVGSQSSIQSPLSSSMTGRSAPGSFAPPQRVLMAATVERLVAELTSKIEVELLASFFLTYRTYLQPVHLLQAFTTRFDWAMQPPSSPADDAARRIVRVRTFVVIRYWLLNHFVLDFYPDRELRTTLTVWLNKRGRDEAIRNNPKDQRLIKGLKKLVRRLKDMHAVLGPTDTIEARAAIARQSTDLPPMPKSPALSDEDVDLDVVPAMGSGPTAPKEFGGAPRDRSRLPTSSAKDKLTTRPTSLIPLPGGQSAVARSINNALGTIGRFKRMLGNRAHVAQASSSSLNPSASAEAVEVVEYEQHDTGDLLWIKDGLDRYLDFYNIPRDVADPEDISSGEVQSQHVEAGSLQPVAELEGDQLDASESDQAPSVTAPHESLPVESAPATHVIGCAGPDESASQGRWPSSVSSTDPDFPHKPPNTLFFPPSSIPIFEPASYNEYDSSRSGCLELDDVDLSDEDDDVVEVKRTLKRLPGAANLRLATSVPRKPTAHHRLSTETVSSYGSPCRPSFEGHDRESMMVSWVDDEVSGAEPGVLPGLEGFLLDGLVESDEEEPGDIEAALRRLEGIVDDSRERKKAERVEEQMVKSERKKQGLPWLATASQDGPSANGEPRDSVSTSASLSVSVEQPVSPTSTNLEACEIAIVASDVVSLNSSNPSQPSDDHPVAASPNRTVSRQLRAVPRKASIGNLLARTPARASTRAAAGPRGPQASAGPAPPRHRSFLLHCRTEVIAQQFYLIERDMLRVLAWPELVSGAWRDRSQPQIEVLDWEAHVKERRRVEILAKESGESKSSSAVQAVIARFNLTANWVASEILLTANPDERVALIAKFIRLAFKCYCQSNFQTLTQIIHGLQLHDVERLNKTWARVPSWEMRKFRGMQVFVSHLKNFKHLREVTKALISEYGPPGQRRPLSANDPYRSVKGTEGAPVPLGCIPFLGLFLRDLTMNAELPTFLDPSSTDTPAEVDAEGTLVSLADPNAFNSLAPLPPSLRMRPLVNVHKFRVQARIVQDVLAAMEFAESYPYDPDARWYLKCLKLRALSSDVMSELSRRLEP
ncbi:hypothetical protein MVLG_06744 [Microbotryum lychnidis-dioicae p1A1 Lamole]|uniref:Ras GEF n=1 Tax=Microbotryum lychnidis-dioicae (strain p1A1 Lamole / MvSl-1064) TaxID=683840 RepID=U5HI79_USTV1|nr:hypothetical protein MVLG_06744 [Microbotryum lychnidis-dioicae p1A1 Lamole]|eukprot:KDE02730.1 hypothetical protein MVLG_06744 [Microbotryum lychnidis-dioicae p1A1 Lamole]